MPPGVTFRPAGPDGLEAAVGILAAEETALRGETQWSREALREWWAAVDHPDNAFLGLVDDRPAALGLLFVRDDLHDCWGAVAPEFWGRGLGAAVLERLESRARGLGARRVQHVVYEDNPGGRRLLESRGYGEVRRFYRMELELEGALPEPTWPAGLRPAPFARADARAFHGALCESFANEWNFAPSSFEDWKALRLGPGADTSLWFLARDGEEVAGVVRCERFAADVAWVAALGVRGRWRRRGLGLALLRHAFAEFARHGMRQALLGVDAENPTGATRLYERAGMRVKDVNVIYARELA